MLGRACGLESSDRLTEGNRQGPVVSYHKRLQMNDEFVFPFFPLVVLQFANNVWRITATSWIGLIGN